ncbi:MAG: hypothetical protein WCJ83_01095 [Actinomycetes bacterium]
MDPMNKPEWFQLVESDGGLPRRNVKRGFRALALSVPLMAIGIGVVVAQTSNEAPAIAETTSVAATQSPLVTTSTPTLVTAPSQSTKAVQTIQPAIAQPPTGGGDDEGDDEGDDD